MTSCNDGLQRHLGCILAEPTCIVGVGNLLRNDDAVGVHIAARLEHTVAVPHTVVAAEDVIENYVFRIADGAARNVLVIDAIRAEGAETGALVLGRIEDIEAGTGAYSTHKQALSLSAGLLRQHGKAVYLLGIVAANTDFGTDVSPQVHDSAEVVIDLIESRIRAQRAG